MTEVSVGPGVQIASDSSTDIPESIPDTQYICGKFIVITLTLNQNIIPLVLQIGG